MTTTQIANSNITGLIGTLLVRLISGPLCDKFGPRYVFAGILLAGSIPTALAGTVTTPGGVIALRLFIGILGGSFVPCQVWTTGFFDKNIVGTANALTGGWGNAGGGITYFVMPAVFDSLVHHSGFTAHKAWRVAFIVPWILITATAFGLLLLCPDTPTGKWSDRKMHVVENVQSHGIVDVPGSIGEKVHDTGSPATSEHEHKLDPAKLGDHEAPITEEEAVRTLQGEVVQAPTTKEFIKVCTSPSTLALALPYFCSFGAELAINGVLANYYLVNFPKLGQTGTGRWAAMFGLLNIVTRPLGGFISDIIYNNTNHSVWAKRFWVSFLGIMAGIFSIIIGVVNSKDHSTMFGLIAGAAFFIEASNGAIFSVVPHVHPFANGVVSGFVGGIGNLGGIVFAIVFRYHGMKYYQGFYIIGAIAVGVNVAVCWIRPFPKNQIGGR
jgi:NNP family nitrate/nitrite transporter-like MFS transporter